MHIPILAFSGGEKWFFRSLKMTELFTETLHETHELQPLRFHRVIKI